MNRSLQVFVAATVVVSLAACEKENLPIKTTSTGETNVSSPADSVAERGHSLVRVVNAVTGGKDVAVELGDQTLFSGVKVGSVTDYRETSSNLASFSVKAPGAVLGSMLAQTDQILLDGMRYTVFLVAEDVSKNTLRVVRDEVIPDSGKARIRVLQASFGAPELDIRVFGAKDDLFSGVNFKSEAGYADVEPATVTLELRAANEPKVLLRVPRVVLKRGTSTTIVITGGSKLSSFRFTDALMAPTPKV
jgi:hypothetical protein